MRKWYYSSLHEIISDIWCMSAACVGERWLLLSTYYCSNLAFIRYDLVCISLMSSPFMWEKIAISMVWCCVWWTFEAFYEITIKLYGNILSGSRFSHKLNHTLWRVFGIVHRLKVSISNEIFHWTLALTLNSFNFFLSKSNRCWKILCKFCLPIHVMQIKLRHGLILFTQSVLSQLNLFFSVWIMEIV